MAIEETVYKKGKECDIFIEPPLSDFNMFDTAAADKIFKIGYDEAVKFKPAFFGVAEFHHIESPSRTQVTHSFIKLITVLAHKTYVCFSMLLCSMCFNYSIPFPIFPPPHTPD